MSQDIVYWTMKNGEKISVDDMDINHLRNTLKMIIRNRQKRLDEESDFDDTDDITFDPYWDLD